MSKVLASLAVLALPLLYGAAHATPTLELKLSESGFATRTFAGTDGVANFGPTPYGTFRIVSGTGVGAPNGDMPTLIDLNSLQVSSSTGGMLTIAISETGLTSAVPSADFFSALGGTLDLGNTLRYQTYIDTSNTLFGTQQTLADLSFNGSVPFGSASTDPGLPGNKKFSETEIFTLTAQPNTETSFDGRLNQVPEPASVALMGAGLLGLAACSMRRRRA